MSYQDSSGHSEAHLHGRMLVWISGVVLLSIIVFVIAAFMAGDEGDDPESRVILAETEEPAEAPPQLFTPTTQPLADDPPEINSMPTRFDPTATRVPIQDRAFDLGIHVQPIQPSVDSKVMHGYLTAVSDQLKLNWVRVRIEWQYVEPEPGVYDWTVWDTFFSEAADFNLKVLVNLATSPAWARPEGVNVDWQGPPSDPAALANFTAALLQRYPGQIHAIEVWNGMNFQRQWDTPAGLQGADYVAVFRQVAETVRALDPNIILISGGLTPTGVNDGVEVVDDLVYLDQMIAAGLLEVVDCVGMHHNGYNVGATVAWDQVLDEPAAHYRGPFETPHPSWSFYSTLQTYANKISLAGREVPLCVTRFGWAVAEDLGGSPQNFEFALDNTLQEQQEWLVQAIQLMQERGYVWLAFIWNLNAGPEAAFDPLINSVPYSLIRPDYNFAPAWLAIENMNFRAESHP